MTLSWRSGLTEEYLTKILKAPSSTCILIFYKNTQMKIWISSKSLFSCPELLYIWPNHQVTHWQTFWKIPQRQKTGPLKSKKSLFVFIIVWIYLVFCVWHKTLSLEDNRMGWPYEDDDEYFEEKRERGNSRK